MSVLGTTRDMVRTDPRRGGAVKRWHTWPVLQSQTVAESSWNVARILVMIWPDAPAQAITHALFNDCGEVVSGDLPFPVKRDNPVLKREVVRLESGALQDMKLGLLALAPAEDIWRQRIKICDMIEMWEFGLYELAMGNLFALPIVDGTSDSVIDLMRQFDLPIRDRTLILEYMEWRRTKTPTRT